MEDQAQRSASGRRPVKRMRILIHAANWVGDALMSTPALACVRAAYPQAFISVLAVPWVEEAYRGNPSVDATILCQRGGRHRGAAGKRQLIQQLRQGRFEMAILFPNSFESALIAYLAKIPMRVGYKTDGRGALLTHGIKRDQKVTARHQVGYYLGIPRSMGWKGGERRLSLSISEEDEGKGLELLQTYGWHPGMCLVAFAPGASYGPAKKWEPSRYAEVADSLMVDFGCQAIIVGSSRDQREAEEVVSRMKKKPWDFTAKTTLGQLAALLSRSDLLITNDSGAMHVAAATETPILALFGPTDPEKTSPYGVRHRLLRQEVECSPCLLRECPTDHRCMAGIEVEEVVKAASALLGSSHRREHNIAVFLDRDGTVNEEVGYLSSGEELRLLPGATEGVRLLNQHGLKAVVVSNQSGVARGYLSESQVTEIHGRLEELLGEEGAYLDGIYFCPHHPEAGNLPYRTVCDCRKPKGGMLKRAASDLDLDLSRSYVIGDHLSDVILGKNLGMKSILVLTGHGRNQLEKMPSHGNMRPESVCEGIDQAIRWVLRDLKEA